MFSDLAQGANGTGNSITGIDFCSSHAARRSTCRLSPCFLSACSRVSLMIMIIGGSAVARRRASVFMLWEVCYDTQWGSMEHPKLFCVSVVEVVY